jgi:hypothetical protein
VSGAAAVIVSALLHVAAVPPPSPDLYLEPFWSSKMGYTWRKRDDGVIVVREGTGPEQILTLSGPAADLMDRVEAQWGDLCRKVAPRYGIRDGVCQSMIRQESRGNAKARNPEKKPTIDDDGVGLMQITNAALKSGHTDAQLEDPEVNITIGCSYLAELYRRYGDDFPKIAAAYNAGGIYRPRPGFENPWGMHSSPGHITSEVSALNYYLLRPLPEADRASILALVFQTETEFLMHDFARGDSDEGPPPTLRDAAAQKKPPSA